MQTHVLREALVTAPIAGHTSAGEVVLGMGIATRNALLEVLDSVDLASRENSVEVLDAHIYGRS